MTTPTRTALITFALALASTAGSVGTASADVLVPARDIGAPGGGGGFAVLEDGAATAAYEDLLAGSGYEGGAIAQGDEPAFVAETQNAGSIRRIESTQTATGALAGGEEVPQARGPVSAF